MDDRSNHRRAHLERQQKQTEPRLSSTMSENKSTGLRIALALLAGTLLSATLLVQWHGRPRFQSARKRLRSGSEWERRLSGYGDSSRRSVYSEGYNDDGANANGDDTYYSYTGDDGVSNNGNNDDGWWSSSRSNGGTKYDNNYLWARDDDDDYYTDDDKGNYWEANKNYKSSNYVTYSGGGGSSVQNNNENYESQTFDGNKGSQQGSSGYQNQDDDQSGEINLGLLTSDQRVGFAITVSVLMVLLLFCFLFGPILVERFCSCFRSGPHTTTKIDLYSTFSNLGDF
mmetsp:Transcript_41939/g.64583  ORF Transcript_41939/g.64583 Transcript_41939/m.64583 type:complete len:285 (+) Transcript_41939:2-856(+)